MLTGKRDYRYASKRGSRGIYLWFLLEQGRLYCVRELVSWTKHETYYVTARDGEVVRLNSEEVDAWLSAL
jgi:hypothetical protein